MMKLALRLSSGVAFFNVLNGEAYEIPMTADEPYSNWDGQ